MDFTFDICYKKIYNFVLYIHYTTVIKDKILLLWIGSPLGPSKQFFTDDRGEFATRKYCDFAENLDLKNTAVFSLAEQTL